MMQLAYEFESVTDKNGVSKINVKEHANPVFINSSLVGRSAFLSYVDKPDLTLKTSTVEEVTIIHNYVKITTKNTIYTLKPTIKDV